MGVDVRLPKGDGPARVAGVIDRLARWLARHWLATFNIFVAIFIGLPFLAPVLAHVGAAGPARLIYAIYAPTCHQLPERSFWLFGPQAVYTVPELESDGAPLTGLNILQRQALRFDGLPETGYKVAICRARYRHLRRHPAQRHAVRPAAKQIAPQRTQAAQNADLAIRPSFGPYVPGWSDATGGLAGKLLDAAAGDGRVIRISSGMAGLPVCAGSNGRYSSVGARHSVHDMPQSA